MSSSVSKFSTLTTGFAMFSMFFGAGNVVFPLALGQYAQSQNIYAILGLLITAVGVPFLGLISMTLFNGHYQSFFGRIGKVPGFLLAAAIMGLIGPFGALPRCIALSFSTLHMYLPSLSLPVFSMFSCLLIYLLTFRKNRIVDILGYALTPFLLIILLVIIIKGFWEAPAIPVSDLSSSFTFFEGLKEGYQTMDLLGAFFFCSVVLNALRKSSVVNSLDSKALMSSTLKASCIGAFLLGAIYVGFSYIAAFYSVHLDGIGKEALLGTISHHILGPYAGIVASAAVALACLTTAIALAAVFAEFLHLEISQNRINYHTSLLITLAISFVFSILNFTGLIAFLAPILQVCYPALIILSALNIAYKLFHFKSVKGPVLAIFIFSLGYYLL